LRLGDYLLRQGALNPETSPAVHWANITILPFVAFPGLDTEARGDHLPGDGIFGCEGTTSASVSNTQPQSLSVRRVPELDKEVKMVEKIVITSGLQIMSAY
jgi:hypothetical protein